MTSSCCNTYIVTDYTSGDSICTNCGNILESSLLVSSFTDHSEPIIDNYEQFLQCFLDTLPFAKTTLFESCMHLFYQQSPIFHNNLTLIAIYHILSSDDIKTLSIYSNFSYNRLNRRIKDLQHLSNSTSESILLQTAYHYNISYQEIKKYSLFYNTVFNHINRSPNTIVSGILHVLFDINACDLLSVSKQSFLKIKLELKDFKINNR